MEESRKRKRGNEEAESSEQKASDWVSDMEYIAWRNKLQHKDFIGERGFNKWVSPFQELVESKGWPLFYEHKAPRFVDVVKEFYANMVGMKDKAVVEYTKGQHLYQILVPSAHICLSFCIRIGAFDRFRVFGHVQVFRVPCIIVIGVRVQRVNVDHCG